MNEWIRLKESCDFGIVNAPVHMDQAHFIQHFVAGKATGGNAAVKADPFTGGQGGPVGGVPSLAPGVEAQFPNDGALFIGDYVQAAQVVMELVVGFRVLPVAPRCPG